MASTRTSRELVLRVLKKLNVLTPGQSVAPEDFAAVSDELDGIVRSLAGLEICYVADIENIPAEWFEPLASIVAGEVAQDFSADVSALKAQGLGGFPAPVDVGAGSAARSLKIMLRSRPTGEPQRTESF